VVTADEVYGGSLALREWLEERHTPYVLAVKCTELLAVPAPDVPAEARASAEQLAAGVPAEQWIAYSAGHGAKGRRLYDWTRIELASPATSGMARWLLRRSRSDGAIRPAPAVPTTCPLPATRTAPVIQGRQTPQAVRVRWCAGRSPTRSLE
jgi:hypothetical protein